MTSLPLSEPQDISESIIIFLDIDGVLLPFGKDRFPDDQLQAFSTILQAHHGKTKVVLSSTWRVQPKFIQDILDQFHQYAYEYGGPLTEICFFDITDPTMHSERHYEIDDWLQKQRKPPLAWVALDDEDLLLGGTLHSFDKHFVRTESHRGLTDDKAQLAILLLQNQIDDSKR